MCDANLLYVYTFLMHACAKREMASKDYLFTCLSPEDSVMIFDHCKAFKSMEWTRHMENLYTQMHRKLKVASYEPT